MNTRSFGGLMDILTPQLFLGPYDNPDDFICVEKSPNEYREIEDHCGIAMAINTKNITASYVAYVLGTQLMHRGRDASGIGSIDGLISYLERRQEPIYPGLPNEVSFFESRLPGAIATYHGRLATWGAADNPNNTQPFEFKDTPFGVMQIAHNGQLVDVNNNAERLQKKGVVFTATSDTEGLGHRIIELGNEGNTFEKSVELALKEYPAAYSLIVSSSRPEQVILTRDKFGVRPLWIGTFAGGYIATSETDAINYLEHDGAKIIREVRPGEMVIFDLKSIQQGSTFRSIQYAEGNNNGGCSFERTYGQRQCSSMEGVYNSEFRHRTAQQLVAENKEFLEKLKKEYGEKLVLIPIPRSGEEGTKGLHEHSGIRMRDYIVRRDTILTGEKRVYQGPSSIERQKIVGQKFYYKKEKINGKFCGTGDDSLVRGDTAKAYNKEIIEAGAIGVGNFFFYPMVKYACFYGNPHTIQSELLIYQTGTDLDIIARELGSNFVRFNSGEGYDKVCMEVYKHLLCRGCTNKEYVTPSPRQI